MYEGDSSQGVSFKTVGKNFNQKNRDSSEVLCKDYLQYIILSVV
jgi:hypothetical protein